LTLNLTDHQFIITTNGDGVEMDNVGKLNADSMTTSQTAQTPGLFLQLFQSPAEAIDVSCLLIVSEIHVTGFKTM